MFDTDGNCLGKVNDLAVNNRCEIENLFLQNDELLNIKDIVNIGKNLIIKNGKKTVKIASLKPKSKILPSTLNTNIKVSIQENSKAKTVATMPKKMIVGSEFLIGRKVGQNIYSDNKQLIIKKQSKITNQIVDIASKNGKLKELTTFSVI